MQSSCVILMLFLCVTMFGVKEVFSNDEEVAEVEFRTGTPQREPELPFVRNHHVPQFMHYNDIDMETAETHHLRRRIQKINRRLGFPLFSGFQSFNPLSLLGFFG
ncbi:uncharacterized protein LOC116344670 [Contarinia nasturtii]|uniref:uncharacterized protein LOC116344670 n=1 Tax=Contarinia nasturtii TaxID=265458 RepID=UPI0012D4237F|nr:uncharacterized protein LOC116344670 [Contarinia nasturtii]